MWGKSGHVLQAQPHKRTRHLRVRLYGPKGHRRGSRGGLFSDFYVHRLICLAFHGDPPFEGALVRHLDGNPQNNTPENLAWGTLLENASDYWQDQEAVYCRDERAGLRGQHKPYTPDLFVGF